MKCIWQFLSILCLLLLGGRFVEADTSKESAESVVPVLPATLIMPLTEIIQNVAGKNELKKDLGGLSVEADTSEKSVKSIVPALMPITRIIQNGASNIEPTLKKDLTYYNVIDEATAYMYDSEIEYIIVDDLMKWNQANLYCQSKFKGYLAVFDTNKKVLFIDDALKRENITSEENIWINGRFEAEQWVSYYKQHLKSVMDTNFLNSLISEDRTSIDKKKHCLAFTKNSFDLPSFIKADCMLPRKFICERHASHPYMDLNKSTFETHSGWIEIGERLFKLFAEPLTFEKAVSKCVQDDHDASLAVALSSQEIEQLGHYMMITRPSIRNAWMGANYIKDEGWSFLSEDFKIPETPIKDGNDSNYPTWSYPRPKNSESNCLTLLRLPNITVFKELPCSVTLEGYICYKNKFEIHPNNFDCADKKYILSASKSTWFEANNSCLNKNSILVEPKTVEQEKCLAYLMTEKPSTPVRHVWIGGKGTNNGNWKYLTSDETYTENKQWLNVTIVSHLDGEYTCLNMDNLSNDLAIFYGTDCMYKQHYVCEIGK